MPTGIKLFKIDKNTHDLNICPLHICTYLGKLEFLKQLMQKLNYFNGFNQNDHSYEKSLMNRNEPNRVEFSGKTIKMHKNNKVLLCVAIGLGYEHIVTILH
jgi:hypothetical protein